MDGLVQEEVEGPLWAKEEDKGFSQRPLLPGDLEGCDGYCL